MSVHLQKELSKIKKAILTLGAMVEERVQKAVESVENSDANLAARVIDTDHEIDHMEVEIEEECLKILALHQPVAVDLRFLVAVIKINNELESIADQAVNIAERVAVIAAHPEHDFIFNYSVMSEKAQSMLKKSLDSLVNQDLQLAFNVLALDDEVDELKKKAYDVFKAAMAKYPDNLGYLINLFLISRHLERLADHAENIAEEVIYHIQGEIVRHGRKTNAWKK
jgi:phosphate transport system protein